jgi:hypothetical protein
MPRPAAPGALDLTATWRDGAAWRTPAGGVAVECGLPGTCGLDFIERSELCPGGLEFAPVLGPHVDHARIMVPRAAWVKLVRRGKMVAMGDGAIRPPSTIEELEAQVSDAELGPVSGYTERPFMLRLDRPDVDLCEACQEFGSGLLYSPNHVPLTPLGVCTCEHECGCRPI